MAIIIRDYLHDVKVLVGSKKSKWGVSKKQVVAWVLEPKLRA
jgi:hypothetical protein